LCILSRELDVTEGGFRRIERRARLQRRLELTFRTLEVPCLEQLPAAFLARLRRGARKRGGNGGGEEIREPWSGNGSPGRNKRGQSLRRARRNCREKADQQQSPHDADFTLLRRRGGPRACAECRRRSTRGRRVSIARAHVRAGRRGQSASGRQRRPGRRQA